MKNKLKKGLAVLLAGTILTSSVTPALAGEPGSNSGRTAYITGLLREPERHESRKECAPQWQH